MARPCCGTPSRYVPLAQRLRAGIKVRYHTCHPLQVDCLLLTPEQRAAGSNGANLSFPKEFDIDGEGTDEWIVGAVNAIIFLTAGLMCVNSSLRFLPPQVHVCVNASANARRLQRRLPYRPIEPVFWPAWRDLHHRLLSDRLSHRVCLCKVMARSVRCAICHGHRNRRKERNGSHLLRRDGASSHPRGPCHVLAAMGRNG